ncbi:MAG: exodeoxyribonuclease VII small subunit [Haloarculaceae archaeon]
MDEEDATDEQVDANEGRDGIEAARSEADRATDEPLADAASVDERIRRLESIVRALESGEADPDERAARIAEGKALVAGLERDLEAVGERTAETEE